MKKILLSFLLLLTISGFAQQTSVAVLPSEGTSLNNDEIEALTDKMREATLKVLPSENFILLKQDVVVKRLGGAENYIKECSESSCIVDLGKKAQVDYVAQASVGKLSGKKYSIVKIGTQTWMAKNLNYDASGSKCYDNNSVNCNKYGRLYNWETAKTACPKGWHLPNNTEWDKLYRYTDGTNGTDSPYKSKISGKYLKTKNDWNNNGNGNDKFGFSALPGGTGNSEGIFYQIGDRGYWWSIGEYNSYFAYNRNISCNNEYANWDYYNKSGLFSVRCIKN